MKTMLPPVPILSGLNPEALKMLSARAVRSVANAGQTVVREGETGNQMFVVESGCVRVYKSCPGEDDIELARLGPGEFFGEGCILDTLPRGATVQALEETVMHSLTGAAFYRLYESDPAQYSILLLNIARDLSRRLRRLDETFAACH